MENLVFHGKTGKFRHGLELDVSCPGPATVGQPQQQSGNLSVVITVGVDGEPSGETKLKNQGDIN